ncbi:DUF1492 domain-containing protein [Bacteroides heparinolyticus]|uniref:DUF1492 domain-containing protein n=1 Tax=Prevotella heparinolytica TaxID=28113 RepID=UPI0035A0C297
MSERELRQYYWIQREIERLYEEIQELGFQTLMIPLNDGIPSPSYQPKDGVGALAVAMVALQEQLCKRLADLYKKRSEIEAFIAGIEDREIAKIVELRYLGLLSWREIGDEMGYDYSVVYKKHRKFLSKNLQQMQH